MGPVKIHWTRTCSVERPKREDEKVDMIFTVIVAPHAGWLCLPLTDAPQRHPGPIGPQQKHSIQTSIQTPFTSGGKLTACREPKWFSSSHWLGHGSQSWRFLAEVLKISCEILHSWWKSEKDMTFAGNCGMLYEKFFFRYLVLFDTCNWYRKCFLFRPFWVLPLVNFSHPPWGRNCDRTTFSTIEIHDRWWAVRLGPNCLPKFHLGDAASE